jgi:aldose sugar dehydrogenase
MITAMALSPTAVVALGLILAQSTTQDCRQTPRTDAPAPANPNPNPAQPSPDVITTQDGARVQVQVVVTNLEIPWSMAFAPDGRLFVTERPGRVRIVNLTGGTSELAVTLDDTFAQGEAGTLGLALDPDFASTRFVYVYYTARTGSGGVNRVVRYREVGGRLAERAVLLDGIPADTIHDGGRIRFGPDGLLYVSTGDAATQSLSQSLGSLAGKILRLNRDGTTPGANPLGSPVFSYGHRNPQGFDWHPATGDLWASEHGSTGNDEINVIRAGANYGWPTIQAAVREQPVRGDAAGHAPVAAAARSIGARPHRGPGAAARSALRTHQGRGRGAGRVPVLLHQQSRRQGESWHERRLDRPPGARTVVVAHRRQFLTLNSDL